VTKLVTLESIVKAIEEGVPVKQAQNREAAREAYATVDIPVFEGVES
jgi:molybdopterin biosynthesis enzyme